MPFAPIINPTPGIAALADSFAGIGQGAQNITDAVTRNYQNGKIAENITRVNPEMLDMLGMSKEQFGSLSARDKSNAVTGAITAMGLKAQQQSMAAKAAAMQAETELRQQQAAENEAVGNIYQRFGQGPPQSGDAGAGAGASAAMPSADAFANVGLTLGPGAGAPAGGAQLSPGALQMIQQRLAVPSVQERVNWALQAPDIGGKSASAAIAALGRLKALYGEGESAPPSQFDTQDIMPGVKVVTKRGSKEFQVVTDPTQPVVTEQVPDAQGNLHTIIRGPKGQALFVPAGNAAQQQKLGIDSLVEAEKATRQIDDDIRAYNNRLKRNKENPASVEAPDPGELKDLQMRRGRLQKAIDSAGGGDDGAAAAPATTGKAASTPAKGAKAATVPAEVQSLMAEANAAIAKGADAGKVRARLTQRLKEKGFSLKE